MMERLRKVNSFSELKIGQIAVVMNCEECGRAKCRGILVAFFDDFECADGGFCRGFQALPICVGGELITGIGEDSIETGDVFIVEDGLETGVRELAGAKTAP